MTDPTDLPPAIDTSVPHSARVWNYWLGGQDNFEADRALAAAYEQEFPGIRGVARASREFLARGIRHLAAAGVEQFLDIGSGLPTADNTHQIVARHTRRSRVVYVDHDPLVLLHADRLMSTGDSGSHRSHYLHGDLRAPASLLAAAYGSEGGLRRDRPTALICSDVLGHICDHGEAQRLVRQLVRGLPAGSYLMICHGTTEAPPAGVAAQRRYNRTAATSYISRTREQIAGLFVGLPLEEPGLVPVPDWRPHTGPATPTPGAGLGGIARIP